MITPGRLDGRPRHFHRWSVLDRQGHYEIHKCHGCGKVERIYVD